MKSKRGDTRSARITIPNRWRNILNNSGDFAHFTPDMLKYIQDRVDRDYQRLLQMEALTNPGAVKKEEPKEEAAG